MRRGCAHRSTRIRRWWASARPTWPPGFFQGFPISSSSSRTPVAEAAGAKTQLTGVVGALADRVAAGAGARSCCSTCRTPRWPPSSSPRRSACSRSPTCAASIASSAGSSGCRSSASPAWRCSAPFPGIALAIVIAVIEFLWDGWRPHSAVLGRVDGVKGYHDITRYPEARLDPGPRAVPLGCAAVLRQRRALPRSRARRRGRVADAGALAGGGGRAGHQRRRDGRRHRRRTRRRRCTPPASSCASPR